MYKIREWLYIGSYRDSINLELLEQNQIGAILQLADTVTPTDITVKSLIIPDGVPVKQEILSEGIAFIREQKANHKKVLVGCGAGISRSVTFALGSLKEEEGGTLPENYFKIRESHPDALPHISLWQSLNQYYGEKNSYLDIWIW